MAELKVFRRAVTGKKVSSLRRQGITPVHLYGHGVESESLQCETAGLKRLLVQSGRTGLINLQVSGEKAPKNVLVREVQRAPDTGELLHVDFFQVSMAEKIKVKVPLVLVGESPALRQKQNMIEHGLTSLEVECLPGEIPAQIELDISGLTEAEQAIRVKDIPLARQITLLDDPDRMVVRITSRPLEIEEEVVAKEVVVVGEEAKAVATGASEAAAEETTKK
ncbi:MAG: 50S ribosomal protein L25 [Chloroflexota bacterium]